MKILPLIFVLSCCLAQIFFSTKIVALDTKVLNEAHEWLIIPEKHGIEATFLRTMLDQKQYNKLTLFFDSMPNFLVIPCIAIYRNWFLETKNPTDEALYHDEVTALEYAFLEMNEQLIIFLIDQHKKHSKKLPYADHDFFPGILSKTILHACEQLKPDITQQFFISLKEHYSSCSTKDTNTFLVWCDELDVQNFWKVPITYHHNSISHLLLTLADPYFNPDTLFCKAYEKGGELSYFTMLVAELCGANAQKIIKKYYHPTTLAALESESMLTDKQASSFDITIEQWWNNGLIKSSDTYIQARKKDAVQFLEKHARVYAIAIKHLTENGYLGYFSKTLHREGTWISVNLHQQESLQNLPAIQVKFEPQNYLQLAENAYIQTRSRQVECCENMVKAAYQLERWLLLANMVITIEHHTKKKQSIGEKIHKKIFGLSKKELQINAWKQKIINVTQRAPWIENYLTTYK